MAHAFLQSIAERVATTFEVLPERVDLLSFVVEIAAATTILGSAMLLIRGEKGGQGRRQVPRPQRFPSWEPSRQSPFSSSIYIAHKIG
jgi:hypothetical protein